MATRVLFAGMIGAAVAAAVWLGLEYVTQMNLDWLSCGVGVVTGYCVHRAAGPHSGGSFVRGALSVLLTLVAIVGGRQVYVKVIEANAGVASTKTIVAPLMSDPEAADGQEDATEKVDEALTQTDKVTRQRPLGAETVGSSQLPLKSSLSEWDMLWICLAALAAYVVGKGRDEVLPPAAFDEPQSVPQSSSTIGL